MRIGCLIVHHYGDTVIDELGRLRPGDVLDIMKPQMTQPELGFISGVRYHPF